jgi:hypothetical protein
MSAEGVDVRDFKVGRGAGAGRHADETVSAEQERRAGERRAGERQQRARLDRVLGKGVKPPAEREDAVAVCV